MVCRVCGRGPAQTFTIRRHVGMLVLQRFVHITAPLCKEHATSMAKEFLGKTLVQGWWGIISFFANWFDVFTDLSVLSRAKRMAEPVGALAPAVPHMVSAESVQTPVPPPPGTQMQYGFEVPAPTAAPIPDSP